MNGTQLAEKIYDGFARTGAQTGFAYDVYRPQGAGMPLMPANKCLSALPCTITHDARFRKPVAFAEPVWWSWHDARLTQVADYLAGHMGIFYIAAQQDLLPILLVQCNRTLTVSRPAQPDGIGAVGYGGDVAGNDVVLLHEWPASVLQGTKGEANPAGLPMDMKMPWWRVLLPAMPGLILNTGDVITDDLGRRYFIHSAELSALGWRITAMEVEA